MTTTTDIPYNDEDTVCENGFFDEKYFSAELPEDFFSCVAKNFSEDPIVKYTKEKIRVGEVECSHFHKINYDRHVIELGASEVVPMRYEIDHDEDSVMCVQDWYEDFMKGSNKLFPDVPVADIHVPGNQLEKEKVYELQLYMARNGFALGNPTYTDAYNMADYCDLVSDQPLTLQEINISNYDKSKKIFFPFEDDRRTDHEKMVTMQFNPFHPMSLSRIIEIKSEDAFTYTGKYKMYNRIYPFTYSIRDQRYRIHSDQWMLMARVLNSVYEIFDLVGNYDFIDDLYTDRGVKKIFFDLQRGYQSRDTYVRDNEKERRSVTQLVHISPYMILSDMCKKDGYSCIGPWGGNPVFGVGDIVYVPYITFPVEEGYVKSQTYKDVTTRCQLNEKTGRLSVFRSADCVKFDLLERYKYGEYFVRTSKLGVRIFREDPNGIHKFIKVPYHVYGYPTNGEQSLVYPYGFLTPLSYYNLTKHWRGLIDFLPLSILDKEYSQGVSMNFDYRQKEDDDLLQDFERYVSQAYQVRRRHFKGTLDRFQTFLGVLQENEVSGFVVYREAFFDGEIQYKGELIGSYEDYLLEELDIVPGEKGFKVIR